MRSHPATGRRAQPQLETLEERAVPSTVVSNFENGVWRWDDATGWAYLSTSQAEEFAVDDAGNVFATFDECSGGAIGLWRWNAATASWALLSSGVPEDIEEAGNGVLYADFGCGGLWRWSFSGWMLLSTDDAVALGVSDTNPINGQETLFSLYQGSESPPPDFSALRSGDNDGVWSWNPVDGWARLTQYAVPYDFGTDDLGGFVGAFCDESEPGTWRWSAGTGWQRLSEGWVYDLVVAEDGTVYENRGNTGGPGGGIWRWAPGGTFQQITRFTPGVIAPLPNGNLVAVFWTGDAHQLWHYHAASGSWTHLLGVDAGHLQQIAVGKDGNLYLGLGSDGLLRVDPLTGATLQLSSFYADTTTSQAGVYSWLA